MQVQQQQQQWMMMPAAMLGVASLRMTQRLL
jgi:hypothetical protein